MLLHYQIYVLACTCLLPRESRETLSPARIIGDFFDAFILPATQRNFHKGMNPDDRWNEAVLFDIIGREGRSSVAV